jgi:hypothetical protein
MSDRPKGWGYAISDEIITAGVHKFFKTYAPPENSRRHNSDVKELTNTVEPGYNDIGLYDTSLIASDVLWCQLILHC